MQLLFTDELESFIVEHPDATYDELKNRSREIWKRKNAEICTQFKEDNLLAPDSIG